MALRATLWNSAVERGAHVELCGAKHLRLPLPSACGSPATVTLPIVYQWADAAWAEYTTVALREMEKAAGMNRESSSLLCELTSRPPPARAGTAL